VPPEEIFLQIDRDYFIMSGSKKEGLIRPKMLIRPKFLTKNKEANRSPPQNGWENEISLLLFFAKERLDDLGRVVAPEGAQSFFKWTAYFWIEKPISTTSTFSLCRL
jgi:hypothetical protein